MSQKIEGAQRDFSFGEVDVALKRSDEHPARKAGLRQMANMRILNSGSAQNRSGRRALYPITNGGTRTERFTISAGNKFDIQFAPGRLKIIDSTGTTVGNFTAQGNGAELPWASAADINSIVYAIFNQTITICFGHAMRPQVVSWDGVVTWSIADYTEPVFSGQKRTPFYRVSPQGITLQPGNTGGPTTIEASSALFTPAWVGARLRWVNKQVLITQYNSPTLVHITVQETLYETERLSFAIDATKAFAIGDVVKGTVTGATGIVAALNPSGVGTMDVILLQASAGFIFISPTSTDIVVGPSGYAPLSAATVGVSPAATAVWDDEVMNNFRGYPASCFTDQYRVGFCDFPSVPGGIGWSAINSPTDLYVGANPNDAVFEIAPGKVQVYYVVPGPESSEFVFCDRKIYYIPISPTNPLKPGSVAFQLLSGDGAAQVQPRISQEAILYANAGQNSMMAIIATGAYTRPFNTKNLSDFHGHLFNNIAAIAAPNADSTFNERYAYVLNGDGSVVVGKYNPESLQTNLPVIGWGPWSGSGAVSWIAAWGSDVLFTSSYFGAGICEALDDTQYLDASLFVNNLPATFAPPGAMGPLWLFAGQSVSLMDQVTRSMGAYQIDANGFIIPQNNGGEDLTVASLVAGQPWTSVIEPFCPDANPGADAHQRMRPRRVARFAAYVVHSTGFVMGRLFSGKVTPTSPALGTLMNFRRFPAWNQGDDPTLPPPSRETTERIRPLGRTFDPRVAIIKDTPGPLQVLEIGIEATI